MILSFTGFEEVKEALLAINVTPHIMEALEEEGDAILKDSQDNYVPVDEEDLKKSGKRHPAQISGKDIIVDITYGDAKTDPYALTVHETPSKYDPRTWVGKTINFQVGGPKYLEIPLFVALQSMDERLADKLNLDKIAS